jgi:NADPH:quinone reductase-like Zn-dependent oxidoreductase
MNAIIFNETGLWTDNLKLCDTEIKEPMENEVQVKVLARPVNPSDEMFIKGVYRQKPELPQIAGLEGAGRIEKVGKKSDNSLIGQHIAFRAKGTWADKINIPIDSFRIVPKEIPFEIACQLTLNTVTAFALLELSNLAADQWLLLTAASSSVCKQIIQLAKAKKIRVVALVRNDKYKNDLLKLGADIVLNSETENIEEQVINTTKGGANAILDSVGGALGSIMIKVAAPFGKVIIYGRQSPDETSFAYGTVIYKNLKIEGFGIDHWLKNKSKDKLNLIWQELTTAIINNSLKLHCDKLFDLKDFKEAIIFYKNTGGKVVLR